MKLLRTFPIMVFAQVLLSIIGFCIAQKSVELMLVAGTLAALSWYVTEGPRGRSLPRWVSNVLVIAVSLSVIIDLVQHPQDMMGVLGRFAVWLTLIKLYERRTARDHAHLMSLSLLLILVGCIKSAELLFGVVLLLYAALALYVLLLFQLYASFERVSETRRDTAPEDKRPPPMRPTIGRHVTLQFRSLTALVGVMGITLSVALFLIFPRNLSWALFDQSFTVPGSRRVSGYTDSIDLINGTRITDSRRAVFELALIDESGSPLRLDEPLLLRGAVLDSYLDGRWSVLGVPNNRIETSGSGPELLSTQAGDEETGRSIIQDFRFFAGTETVFGLYVPVSIETTDPHHLVYDTTTQTLLTTPRDGALRRYAIESRLDPSDLLVRSLSQGQRPPSNRRGYFRDAFDPNVRQIRELAVSLLGDAELWPAPDRGEDRWQWHRDAASIFADYLRSDIFRYTLDLSDLRVDDRDPIVEFLFNARRGHCEFFASALAALCRTVAIDARVVTGYVAYEYDETTDRYIVLESNAHAWVEVRTGRYRYAPFDPTPPGVLPSSADPASSLTDRLGWFYQRLEGSWTNGIVYFDDRSQSEIFESLDVGWSRRLTGFLDSGREWMARVNRAFYFGKAGYIWLGIVAVTLLIAIIAAVKFLRRLRLIRRTLRLRRLRAAEARRLMRQLGFYVDMLSVLQRGGCPKPAWQPPLDFARGLSESRPGEAGLVREVAQVYYEARYGLRRLTAEELTQARHVVRDLASGLGVRL